jgi:hypothetical protein
MGSAVVEAHPPHLSLKGDVDSLAIPINLFLHGSRPRGAGAAGSSYSFVLPRDAVPDRVEPGTGGLDKLGPDGWSSSSLAARYQHLTTQIRRDIAKRVGGLIWEQTDAPSEKDDDGPTGVSAAA